MDYLIFTIAILCSRTTHKPFFLLDFLIQICLYTTAKEYVRGVLLIVFIQS
jgi:hypothetical protein